MVPREIVNVVIITTFLLGLGIGSVTSLVMVGAGKTANPNEPSYDIQQFKPINVRLNDQQQMEIIVNYRSARAIHHRTFDGKFVEAVQKASFRYDVTYDYTQLARFVRHFLLVSFDYIQIIDVTMCNISCQTVDFRVNP